MTSNQTEIICGEVLRIAQAAAMYAELASVLGRGSNIRINISELNQIDAAGVQLLYGFQRDASVKGIELHWSEPAPALREATHILGLPAFYE